MTFNEDKQQALADNEGYPDLLSLVEAYAIDSVCPGICMNPGCDYTTEVEPDQDAGWCECCETRTVKSGMELLLF